MLILTKKVNDTILIGKKNELVSIKVLSVNGNEIKLGINNARWGINSFQCQEKSANDI